MRIPNKVRIVTYLLWGYVAFWNATYTLGASLSAGDNKTGKPHQVMTTSTYTGFKTDSGGKTIEGQIVGNGIYFKDGTSSTLILPPQQNENTNIYKSSSDSKSESLNQKNRANREVRAVPMKSTIEVIKRDGAFIAYNDWTVLDTRTNLMWVAKDNGSNINWPDAKSYSKNYRGGGYTDWRMPMQDELVGLFDGAKTYKSACGNDVYLTGLINLTCNWVWVVSQTRGLDASSFNFSNGGRYWSPLLNGDGNRVLLVRLSK